ncbi:DUF4134 domain-containing protein [Mucilaginibacter conchicola]|uniref:DUF4134 domain-containing protein n=1 Tax=Mucilaginibacter conchicola TaxID=2303333 RepID=A0A372NR52_9SPHI|nr:DUF4134 family protein [Mucilaginibacter conchicola]RFZ91087.1 DUF4134 domain-containing protein [Mucilaginibacter conchicola]
MKKLLTLICCLLWLEAFAQPGIEEMNKARNDLAADYFSASDLSLVLATLLGLNGAVKIYHNWQMGKHHIDADIAAWFFAALFMVLAGAFLKALFGI